ncbi:MAG: hypothetical protein HDR23_05050 [Lachnospiraceae bacterium]|nr:hypothetical protein [Lachnospiraceae bacterium]
MVIITVETAAVETKENRKIVVDVETEENAKTAVMAEAAGDAKSAGKRMKDVDADRKSVLNLV